MTKLEAWAVLVEYQRWRRGGDDEMPNPTTIGLAIDVAIQTLEEAMK